MSSLGNYLELLKYGAEFAIADFVLLLVVAVLLAIQIARRGS